jgi:hypothetical protein
MPRAKLRAVPALCRALVLAAAAVVWAASAARAQERWQVTLHSDSVVWDLDLLALRGDTLLARRLDRGDTLRLPVMELDEVRLVRKSAKRAFQVDPVAIEEGLMGTGDVVVRLTLRERAERLAVLAQILATPRSPER